MLSAVLFILASIECFCCWFEVEPQLFIFVSIIPQWVLIYIIIFSLNRPSPTPTPSKCIGYFHLIIIVLRLFGFGVRWHFQHQHFSLLLHLFCFWFFFLPFDSFFLRFFKFWFLSKEKNKRRTLNHQRWNVHQPEWFCFFRFLPILITEYNLLNFVTGTGYLYICNIIG